MPRLHERRVEAQREIVQRPRLRRLQRLLPHKVGGRRRAHALREFVLTRLLPARRVLEIEIHAREVRLPAARKGKARIGCGELPRALVGVPGGELPRHEIDPVRVHDRDKAERAVVQDLCGGDAVELAARVEGRAELLREAQQQRRSDPLVGVLRRSVEHAVLSPAEAQRPERPAQHAFPDAPRDEEGIARGEPPKAERRQLRKPFDLRRHHGKIQRDHKLRADGQVVRRIVRVRRGNGGGGAPVAHGEGIKAVPAAYAVQQISGVPGQHGAVGLRPRDGVYREAVRRLEAPQRRLCGSAEKAVPRERPETRANQRQLQQLHGRPPAAESQNSHASPLLQRKTMRIFRQICQKSSLFFDLCGRGNSCIMYADHYGPPFHRGRGSPLLGRVQLKKEEKFSPEARGAAVWRPAVMRRRPSRRAARAFQAEAGCPEPETWQKFVW